MADRANETMRVRTLILTVIIASLFVISCGSDIVGGKSVADDTTDPVPPPAGPTCTPAFAECSGLCVDLQTDNSNCGTCGNTCGDGEICEKGKCEDKSSNPLTCLPGLSLCDGICVSLQNDTNNCGTCGNTCLNNRTCESGVCELPPPVPTNEACANGKDDDLDGLVDCMDPDCNSHPNCQQLPAPPPPPASCGNGTCTPGETHQSCPADCKGDYQWWTWDVDATTGLSAPAGTPSCHLIPGCYSSMEWFDPTVAPSCGGGSSCGKVLKARTCRVKKSDVLKGITPPCQGKIFLMDYSA